MTPKPRGGARPGAGRKPLSPHGESLRVEVSLTPEQAAKLAALGGQDWVRARIDRAKVPG